MEVEGRYVQHVAAAQFDAPRADRLARSRAESAERLLALRVAWVQEGVRPKMRPGSRGCEQPSLSPVDLHDGVVIRVVMARRDDGRGAEPQVNGCVPWVSSNQRPLERSYRFPQWQRQVALNFS